MKQAYSPFGVRINGTVDMIPFCTALTTLVAPGREGKVKIDYEGTTEVEWDCQETMLVKHLKIFSPQLLESEQYRDLVHQDPDERLFYDENGNICSESALIWCEEDNFEVLDRMLQFSWEEQENLRDRE